MLLEAFDERDLERLRRLVLARDWRRRQASLAGVNCRDLDDAAGRAGPARAAGTAAARGRAARGRKRRRDPAEMRARVAEAGYDLALVGSALMSGDDPRRLASAMLRGRAARAPTRPAGERHDVMWIKICGITTPEAVAAALEAARRCDRLRVRAIRRGS